MKRNKRRMLAVCWVTYLIAYLCRVNMSSALPKLEAAFGVTNGTLGVAGSLFFIVYAVGQLVNGALGDRVSPYKFVAVAAAGTAVLNCIVSLSGNFYVVLIC